MEEKEKVSEEVIRESLEQMEKINLHEENIVNEIIGIFEKYDCIEPVVMYSMITRLKAIIGEVDPVCKLAGAMAKAMVENTSKEDLDKFNCSIDKLLKARKK